MDKKIRYIDLIIIGSGPAGLTAAIYSGRALVRTLVLEQNIIGGQISSTYAIENYPGFKSITGEELAKNMKDQVENLNITIDEFDTIEKVRFSDSVKVVETKEYIYISESIIIATGTNQIRLPIENEERFLGSGIHYCAVCDGAMYKDEVVGVIGGGNSALEEALYLSNIAKKVIIFRRYDYFKAEDSTIRKVKNKDNIEIIYNCDFIDVYGSDFVEGAIIRDKITNEEKSISLKAIFVYIGTKPNNELFKDYIKLRDGYVVTDETMHTNIKGVYAAGDIRYKEYKQVTTAVADGTIAALEAYKYIKNKKSEYVLN